MMHSYLPILLFVVLRKERPQYVVVTCIANNKKPAFATEPMIAPFLLNTVNIFSTICVIVPFQV